MKLIYSKGLRLFGVGILSASALVSAAASSAGDLSCVTRAINWINANNGSGSTINTVAYSTVALHSKGIAAFANGTLTNMECSTGPSGIAKSQCLHSGAADVALLSDRIGNNEGHDQPFNVRRPMSLQVLVIPTDSSGVMVLLQPNAKYNVLPACVGELLTGNDQWGNHWTMSFQLSSKQNVK